MLQCARFSSHWATTSSIILIHTFTRLRLCSRDTGNPGNPQYVADKTMVSAEVSLKSTSEFHSCCWNSSCSCCPYDYLGCCTSQCPTAGTSLPSAVGPGVATPLKKKLESVYICVYIHVYIYIYIHIICKNRNMMRYVQYISESIQEKTLRIISPCSVRENKKYQDGMLEQWLAQA